MSLKILLRMVFLYPIFIYGDGISERFLDQTSDGFITIVEEAPPPTTHRIKLHQSPSIVATYSLIDLGETDLPQSMLTHLQDGTSLGPKISNKGKIICNESKGGFVFEKNLERHAPKMQGSRIYLHGINDNEHILQSIRSSPYSVEWFIWPTGTSWDTPRIAIETVEQEGYKVHLTTINDFNVVVGDAMPFEYGMPLIWTEARGLYRVGHRFQLNLQGRVKSLNNSSAIAGKSHGKHENFPFYWDGKELTNLFSFRKQFCCPVGGKIQFEDLLLTGDNTMLGTFWINDRFFEDPHHTDELYQAFSWSAKTNEIRILDLKGMRFSAINSDKRLVGAMNGTAAYRDEQLMPIDLMSAPPQDSIQDWRLIEATDINDEGQIVGFGTRGDKTHLFLANPL